jgi:hypothetical protein
MNNPNLLQTRLSEGYVYFPDDTVEQGIDLLAVSKSNFCLCTSSLSDLKVAVLTGRPESIETLLKLWESILPCQGLPKFVHLRQGCI